MGCKVAITGLACVARYASAPYIRPLENEELKDCVLEKEIDLLTITQLLNIAQVHLRLKESIEEAESDMKTLKEIHDGSKTRA
ncbi:hypothetical protein AALP_AA7G217400 [Arabis alpina]|uniref:Uncharacterized protein n=1 Tax=Arabis alpina TaxID=50452 RepID=A0A087GJQ3_ARAAL|nr:hypothetical protein AALP_AA7G217400 [Arabis alpina]